MLFVLLLNLRQRHSTVKSSAALDTVSKDRALEIKSVFKNYPEELSAVGNVNVNDEDILFHLNLYSLNRYLYLRKI